MPLSLIFFGTDLGLDWLGFCFDCIFFLHHLSCGRSVISFLASFHSLLGQFGLLILGVFMSDAFFFTLLFMGGYLLFLSLFTSLVSRVVLYPPRDQEVGGNGREDRCWFGFGSR